MAANDGAPDAGVSNCYVFKSRLQEYAQKFKLPTPVYETIKEGPSHEPSFRSTVTVNGVKYDSLPGFFNRKAAEQSAAEVALLELAKCGLNDSVSQPVHETGLCKNLLQEYAQKMNYAIPLYQCQKTEAPGRAASFLCTVEIGGIKYIGAAAKTKKEAEIRAARTALLAIQSSSEPDKHLRNSELTVLPCRKRTSEQLNQAAETMNVTKAKKGRFRKKFRKTKLSGDKACPDQVPIDTGANPGTDVNQKEEITGEGVITAPQVNESGQNANPNVASSNGGEIGTPSMGLLSSTSCEVANGVTGAASVVNNSALGHTESLSFINGLNQSLESIQAGASQA